MAEHPTNPIPHPPVFIENHPAELREFKNNAAMIAQGLLAGPMAWYNQTSEADGLVLDHGQLAQKAVDIACTIESIAEKAWLRRRDDSARALARIDK